jgi:hypothetical protein
MRVRELPGDRQLAYLAAVNRKVQGSNPCPGVNFANLACKQIAAGSCELETSREARSRVPRLRRASPVNLSTNYLNYDEDQILACAGAARAECSKESASP